MAVRPGKIKVAQSPISTFSNSPIFNFADLDVTLFVGTPVNPGQTIVFRWVANNHSTRPLDLGTISISLQLVDAFGNLDPSGVLFADTLSKSVSAQVVQRGGFTSGLIELGLTDEMAKRVYVVGTFQMRLIVKGTGNDGPFQSEIESLTVVLPTIDDTWWMWTVSPTDFEWKRNYLISGSLTNLSQTSITVGVTLVELESSGAATNGTQVNIGTVMISSPVGEGQNVELTFGQFDLTKRWQWFVPGLFASTLPPDLFRRYIYSVRLDVTDQFQNGYPPFTTTQNLSVDVNVSNLKQDAQAVAVGCETAALCALIAAAAVAIEIGFGDIAAAVLLGVATALEAAAQIAGAAANDPPVADPLYGLLVKPAPTFPASKAEKDPLGEFLHAVTNVVAHVEAMGETDSRIAGAHEARDDRALSAQRAHFSALATECGNLGKAIGRRTAGAVEFIEQRWKTITPDNWDRISSSLTHDMDFRAKAIQAFSSFGGTADGFQTLLDLAVEPRFRGAVFKTSNVFYALGAAAQRLSRSAAATKPTDAAPKNHPKQRTSKKRLRSSRPR